MSETEYDLLKQFATKVKNELSYDLKVQVLALKQYASFMQIMIEQIDPNIASTKEIQEIYKLAQQMGKRAEAADDIIGAFIDYAQMISKKHPHRY